MLQGFGGSSRDRKINGQMTTLNLNGGTTTDLKVAGGTRIKGSLKVKGPVQLTIPTIIDVGTDDYPTIQSAIDAFKNMSSGQTLIRVPKGCYDEYITLENFSSSVNSQGRDFRNNDEVLEEGARGLQIVGDGRPFIPCKTYVNGYENTGDSGRGTLYSLTTTSPASGPYECRLSSAFGGIGGFSGGVQIANPLLAGSPLTNTFAPNEAALCSRGGGIGFVTKAYNSQTGGGAGAAACIIYNNNPFGFPGLGGTSSKVTIPTYGLKQADGLALQTLIMSNPGIQINITPVDPVYSPALGTNYAITQLSLNGPRNVLTITMTGPLPVADDNILAPPVLVQPDFTDPLLELEVGDKITLADSDINGNFAKSVHTITAFSANTLTITPPVPAVGSGGVDVTQPGASVTFLPNVCISPSAATGGDNPPRCVYISSGINHSVTGLWIDQHVTQPFANVLDGFRFADAAILASNLAVTDTHGTSANNWGIHIINANTYIEDGYRGITGRWAVIGWSEGIGCSSECMLRSGDVFASNIRQGVGFGASIGSNVGIENLRVFGCAGLFQPDTAAGVELGGAGNYSNVNLNVNKLFQIADVFGPGVALFRGSEIIVSNPSVRVERCYFPQGGTINSGSGIQVSCGSKMIINEGTYWADGTYRSQPRISSEVNNCYDIYGPPFTYPNVGISVEEGGSFITQGGITFSGNDLNVQTVQDGVFSAFNDAASPQNVYQYTASGVLNNVFEMHEITAASAINLTANVGPLPGSLPSFNSSGPVYGIKNLYVGKTFTVSSSTAYAHTITLNAGASFVGGTNVFTFPASAGSSVTFKVLSPTSVMIIAKV